MSVGSGYELEELQEIKEAAEKMASRMNMRFVLNPDKVREFKATSSFEEDEKVAIGDSRFEGPRTLIT